MTDSDSFLDFSDDEHEETSVLYGDWIATLEARDGLSTLLHAGLHSDAIDGHHPLLALLCVLDILSHLRSVGILNSKLTRQREFSADSNDSFICSIDPAYSVRENTNVLSDREKWVAWLKYMAVLYAVDGTDPARTTTPFALHPKLQTALRRVFEASRTKRNSSHECEARLKEACCAIIGWIRGPDNYMPPAELAGSLLNLSHTALRSPDFNLQNTIATHLSHDDTPTTSNFTTNRFILSIVLKHYAPSVFGQSTDASGTMCYARDLEDDAAIKLIFQQQTLHKRVSTPSSLEILADSSEAQQERAANLQLLKRDDKVRWIFGETVRIDDSGIVSNPVAASRSDPTWAKDRISTIDVSDTIWYQAPTEFEEGRRQSEISIPHSFASSGPRGPHSPGASVSSASTTMPTPQSRLLKQSLYPAYSYAFPEPQLPASPLQPKQQHPSQLRSIIQQGWRTFSEPVTAVTSAPLFSNSTSRRSTDSLQSEPSLSISPMKNSLSADQKRHLVRSRKKLQSVLGTTYDEIENAATFSQYNRPIRTPRRSSIACSTPTLHPKSSMAELNLSEHSEIQWANMNADSSMSSSGSVCSPKTPSSASTFDSFPPLLDEDEETKKRQERRRKLNKLQDFLGERVTPAIALDGGYPNVIYPERIPSDDYFNAAHKSTALWRKASEKLSAFAKSKQPKSSPNSGDEASPMASPERNFVQAPVFLATTEYDLDLTSVKRVRKLEKMFGALPPQMYSQALLPHRRCISDLTPRFIDNEDPPPRSPADKTSAYRQSIVSLQWIAENDPHLVDEIAVIYDNDHLPTSTPPIEEQHASAADNHSEGRKTPYSTRSGVQTPSEGRPSLDINDKNSIFRQSLTLSRDDCADLFKKHAFRDSVLSGITEMSDACSVRDVTSPVDSVLSSRAASPATGRASSDSYRIQFRRAHKLAKVFGTTRGAVLSKVLADIEVELREDDEIEEDEKADMLQDIYQLRQC